MSRLDWSLVAGGPIVWADASSASAPAPAARLPTSVELVEAIAGAEAGAAVFSFGAEAGAVWAADGSRVDPASEDVTIAGPAPADAEAQLVWVTEKQRAERPAAPQKQVLQVLGYMDDHVFQQCTEAASHLNAEFADEYDVSVDRCMGFEFEKKRDAMATAVGSDAVKSMRVIVYNKDAQTCVTGEDFIATVTASTSFRLFELPPEDPQSYHALGRAAMKQHLSATGSKFAWMLIKIDGQVAGRVVFQLYSERCPKTSLNFLHLCRGDLDDAKDADGNSVKLSYKGSNFYRVVKGGWVQGGDIAADKKGNGGMSIYGRHFPDEGFDVPHDDVGVLGMCNDGEHTNSSSFYVTLKRMAWMNRRYVAFGRVVEGLEVIRAIHDVEVSHNQTPKPVVTIDDCGDVPLDG